MSFEPQPFLDDDTGEQLGWIVPGDDGETYLVELDGTAAAIWDDDGQDWAIFDDEPEEAYEAYEDPRLAEYEQRLAAIEYEAQQPRPIPEVMITRGMEEADVQRIRQDMENQADYIEAQIGRPLLLSERRAIAEEAMNDIDSGAARPDLAEAAYRSGGLIDLDDDHPGRAHEARTAFMVERLNDQQRRADHAQGLDDVTYDEPPAQQSSYDMDSREERLAYYDDRLRGATGADSAYSSSDFKEAWEQ